MEPHVSEDTTTAIATILRESSVCRQIVTFLLENETAMDTVKGIAAWWLGCDEIAAQAALDQLRGCGVVDVHTLGSGSLYGLTRDSNIRTSIRVALMRELRRREKPPRRTKKVLVALAAGAHKHPLGEPA
jgi:hypothetical protein